MKKLVCVLLALLLLSGCAALEEKILPTSTPAASLSVSPVATIWPTATPTPSPTTAPTPQPPFPDIVFTGEESANSNAMLYEDDDNIFTSNYLSLIQIHKSDGRMTEIAEGYGSFTLLDGKVYYTPPGDDEAYDTIAVYNPSDGQCREVLHQPYGISALAAYNHKLYFTRISGPWDDYDFPLTDLYSCNPDGSNITLIKKDVYTFCTNSDTIYYTLSSYPDGAPLNACRLNGSKERQLRDWIDWKFDVKDGWMYCYTGDFIVNNLSSGEDIVLPDCQACVLAGQYAFYVTYGEHPLLCALDLNTRITYTLAQLKETNSYYGLEATGQAIYLCDNYTGSISRLSVQSGAVKLDTVVQLGTGWN